uniref:Fibrinogen C-terminal domain-containing protein n=1 Tax=Macrostomum lignano TaxID=282301 RepID=A0A1I8FBL8_9PLAT
WSEADAEQQQRQQRTFQKGRRAQKRKSARNFLQTKSTRDSAEFLRGPVAAAAPVATDTTHPWPRQRFGLARSPQQQLVGRGRVRHFALSSIKQASDVLQCAAQAAKHLLAHQLLVFVTSLSDCWISIQRRVDNSTDFYRATGPSTQPASEREPTRTTGSCSAVMTVLMHFLIALASCGCELLSIELCLTTAGLRAVHSLTWPSGRALRMRMRLWNGTEFWADYSSFSVASEADKFRLSVSGFHGSHPSLGDVMAFHNGMQFSTIDSDNDAGDGSCSLTYKGGWWPRRHACSRTAPMACPRRRPSAPLGLRVSARACFVAVEGVRQLREAVVPQEVCADQRRMNGQVQVLTPRSSGVSASGCRTSPVLGCAVGREKRRAAAPVSTSFSAFTDGRPARFPENWQGGSQRRALAPNFLWKKQMGPSSPPSAGGCCGLAASGAGRGSNYRRVLWRQGGGGHGLFPGSPRVVATSRGSAKSAETNAMR